MITPECENCGCDESFASWPWEKCGQVVILCTACNTLVIECGCARYVVGDVFLTDD